MPLIFVHLASVIRKYENKFDGVQYQQNISIPRLPDVKTAMLVSLVHYWRMIGTWLKSDIEWKRVWVMRWTIMEGCLDWTIWTTIRCSLATQLCNEYRNFLYIWQMNNVRIHGRVHARFLLSSEGAIVSCLPAELNIQRMCWRHIDWVLVSCCSYSL